MCPVKYSSQDISYDWCYASQHFTVLLAIRVIKSLDPCTIPLFSHGYASQDVSSKGNSDFTLHKHSH